MTTTVDGKEKREQKPVDAGYVSDADAEALYGRADLSYRSNTDMGGDKDAGIPDKTQAEAIAIIQTEAQAILDERKTPLRSLDMTAVELAEIGADYRLFKVGTVARALVQILNINTTLAVRSVKRDFIDAGNSTVSFGKEAATISGASFGGGGSASGGSSGGSGQVGPQGPAGPQGPQGVQGPQGPAGADGADGVSPSVTVTDITGGHRITITDANGTSTFDVMDGSGSGSENVVAMSKVNGAWQLDSGMWRVLWNHFSDEIRLITTEGNDVRNLYKVSLSYTNSSSITSVDLYFSDQRYNGRTAEGRAFKFTVPETGTGTITEITAADIPTSGGGGSAGYEIPITGSSAAWSTVKKGDEVYSNADNCVLVVNGTRLIPLSSEKYTESGVQYVRIVGIEYDPLNASDYGFCAFEIVAENSSAFTPIITRRDYNSTDSIRHKIFYYNESTNAVTKAEGGAAKGLDINDALTAGSSSVYIIGVLSQNGDLTYHFYKPDADASPGSSTGSVKFSRTTETGVEILTIPANSSTATKTVIPYSSASGHFVRIDYNGNTADVTHNGTAITGTQIKALLDQTDAGAIMVDAHGDPDAVYHLKNIYSDGRVEFEGEIGDNIINVIVQATNSTGYATVTRKTQVYYYLDGTTVKSAQTNNAVTSQQIYNATIRNGFAPIIYVDEYSERRQFHFYSLDSGGINFRTIDGAQEIRVLLGSSTVSRSFVNPYSVYAVYDSANSKYVLKKGSTLSSENVTYSDLNKHVRNVWLNSQLPIHKLTLSDGYMEFRFIDMQVANGGVSVVQWLVQAGSVTGVTVTRNTI